MDKYKLDKTEFYIINTVTNYWVCHRYDTERTNSKYIDKIVLK